jgi:cyclopropane fatty-acyl-phospholipid synthase-like methyltransferase
LKEKYKSFENIKIINDDVVNFLNSNTLKFDLIMSFQVIEHISKGALVDLFDSAAR